MKISIKTYLLGVLGITLLTMYSKAACNAADHTLFIITEVAVTGPTETCLGKPTQFSTTISTSPAGYEDELSVTWTGGPDAAGNALFTTAGDKYIYAEATGPSGAGSDCSKKNYIKHIVKVYKIKGLTILSPSQGDSLTSPGIAYADCRITAGSGEKGFPINVSWSGSAGVSANTSAGKTTTFTLSEVSHNCSKTIMAKASRYTESVTVFVRVKTFNAVIKQNYDQLTGVIQSISADIAQLIIDIAGLEASITNASQVEAIKKAAEASAQQTYDSMEESINNIIGVVEAVQSFWSAKALCEVGFYYDRLKEAVGYLTEQAADDAIADLKEELKEELMYASTPAGQALSVASQDHDMAIEIRKQLEAAKQVKEVAKASKELERSNKKAERNLLNYCL